MSAQFEGLERLEQLMQMHLRSMQQLLETLGEGHKLKLDRIDQELQSLNANIDKLGDYDRMLGNHGERLAILENRK